MFVNPEMMETRGVFHTYAVPLSYSSVKELLRTYEMRRAIC